MAEIKALNKKHIVITKKDLIDGMGNFACRKGTPLVITGTEWSYHFAYDEKVMPDYFQKPESIITENERRFPGVYVGVFSERDYKGIQNYKLELKQVYPRFSCVFNNLWNIIPNNDEFLEKTHYKIVPYLPSSKAISYSVLKDIYGDKGMEDNFNSNEGYGINIVYKAEYSDNLNMMDGRRGKGYVCNNIFFGLTQNYDGINHDTTHKIFLDRMSAFHKERCKTFKGILAKLKDLREELLRGAEKVEVRLGNEEKVVSNDVSNLLSIIFTLEDIEKLKGGE